MRYLLILVIALAAACGKEETPATKTMPVAPGTKVETPAVKAPEAPAAPTTDAAKAALDKSIADTKALIAKKEADAKALLEKVKTDPMKAATYQAEADKLQKEIADLQAKLAEYMKQAGK